MDLFICGTSAAAGYGVGLEHGYYPQSSWPNFLAKKLGVNNFYNYSLPGRPIRSAIRETKRFIKEYQEEGNSTDDLFVVVELPYLSYREFGTVTAKDGSIAHSIVNKRIVIDELQDNYKKFDNVFFVKEVKRYFDKDRITSKYNFQYEYFDEIDIIHEDLERLHNQVESYYNNEDYKADVYMQDAYTEIQHLIHWFREKKIRYVMYWYSNHQSEPLLRAKFANLYKDCYDKRFITSEELSVQKVIIDFDIEHYYMHPTVKGHMILGDRLYKHIIDNHLLNRY